MKQETLEVATYFIIAFALAVCIWGFCETRKDVKFFSPKQPKKKS